MKGPLGANDDDCERLPHATPVAEPDLHVPASRRMVTLLDEWKKRDDNVTRLQAQLKDAKESLRQAIDELGGVAVPHGFEHTLGFWHRFGPVDRTTPEVIVTIQKWNPGADPTAPNYMVRVFRGLS